MIPKITVVTIILGLSWLQTVHGAAYSKVYVQSGPDVVPVEYLNYGAPAVVASPQIAQLSAPPVGSVLPLPSYVSPCGSPCILPGQTIGSVAAVPANPKIVTYNSPRVPVVVPKDDKTSYEYSYVVYDENTGDRKAQRELSDGSVVRGEYSFIQPDGYVREVKYTADDLTGFNAVVKNFLPESVLGTEKKPVTKSDAAPPCQEVKHEALKVEPKHPEPVKAEHGHEEPHSVAHEEHGHHENVEPVMPPGHAGETPQEHAAEHPGETAKQHAAEHNSPPEHSHEVEAVHGHAEPAHGHEGEAIHVEPAHGHTAEAAHGHEAEAIHVEPAHEHAAEVAHGHEAEAIHVEPAHGHAADAAHGHAEPAHGHEAEAVHELAYHDEPSHGHAAESAHGHVEPVHGHEAEDVHGHDIHEDVHVVHAAEPAHEHAPEPDHVHVEPVKAPPTEFHEVTAHSHASLQAVPAPQPAKPEGAIPSGLLSYNDLIKCVQATIANSNGPKPNISPLTYIILPGNNKPC